MAINIVELSYCSDFVMLRAGDVRSGIVLEKVPSEGS